MTTWWAAFATLVLAGCSSGQPRTQSEEELHAIGPNGLDVGHPHVFLCPNTERLLVDFGRDGLSLRIRQPEGRPSIILFAPAQGTAFRGGGLQVRLNGRELRIVASNGPVRTCLRQTKG